MRDEWVFPECATDIATSETESKYAQWPVGKVFLQDILNERQKTKQRFWLMVDHMGTP